MLSDAMGRVAFNNTGFHSVGEDTAEKTNGAGGRSRSTSDDGLFALCNDVSDLSFDTG